MHDWRSGRDVAALFVAAHAGGYDNYAVFYLEDEAVADSQWI